MSLGVVTPIRLSFAEPLELQSGASITNYELVVETYGQLNEKKR